MIECRDASWRSIRREADCGPISHSSVWGKSRARMRDCITWRRLTADTSILPPDLKRRPNCPERAGPDLASEGHGPRSSFQLGEQGFDIGDADAGDHIKAWAGIVSAVRATLYVPEARGSDERVDLRIEK